METGVDIIWYGRQGFSGSKRNEEIFLERATGEDIPGRRDERKYSWT